MSKPPNVREGRSADAPDPTPGTNPSSVRSAQPADALSYRAAGVDIDAGNEAVARIRKLVASTRRPEQRDEIGGFAGMIGLPSGVANPTLVSCTDGVGTKLLVAIAMNRHDTIGIDAVAMNINDLICTGARPLFVLDYIACGKLDPTTIEAIVSGVVTGCRQSGAALLGGETAELPGLYAQGHYDLAAFAVGVVEQGAELGAHRVKIGDVLLALPSSGLHSNGYSLARKALLDPAYGNLSLDAPLPGGGVETVGEALLRPTRIYEPALAALAKLPDGPLHAAAHITGGGLIDNPPRMLSPDQAVELDLTQLPVPPILRAIAATGVSVSEQRRTFNCGAGMLLAVDADQVQDVQRVLSEQGESGVRVGRVIPKTTQTVTISD